MRMTLLEMVQHILSAMGSDEVSSYDDTVESYQVALTIKQAFYDAAVELGLPEHDSLYELVASGDSAKPTLMTLPSTATRLDKILYDNKTATDAYSRMVEVQYMAFNDFLRMQTALSTETSDVGEMAYTNNGQSFNIMYADNRHPRYYTTTDDNSLIFDSYDSTVDTTLQASKTMAEGSVYPSFSLSNSAYPDLDPTQFPYLLAKAKTRAFNELKQQPNAESAAEARKQKIVVQKRKQSIQKDAPIFGVARYGR